MFKWTSFDIFNKKCKSFWAHRGVPQSRLSDREPSGQTDARPCPQPCEDGLALRTGPQQCGHSRLVGWFVRPPAGPATWKNRAAGVHIPAARRVLTSPASAASPVQWGSHSAGFTRWFCGLTYLPWAAHRRSQGRLESFVTDAHPHWVTLLVCPLPPPGWRRDSVWLRGRPAEQEPG